MVDHRLRKTGIALWLALATVAPARADGPRASYKLDPEGTFISPDKKVRLEQYGRGKKDGGLSHQFWTFGRDHRHGFLLKPGKGHTFPASARGFRFRPDRH